MTVKAPFQWTIADHADEVAYCANLVVMRGNDAVPKASVASYLRTQATQAFATSYGDARVSAPVRRAARVAGEAYLISAYLWETGAPATEPRDVLRAAAKTLSELS